MESGRLGCLDQDHVGGVDGGEIARKPSVGIEV